MASIVYNKAKAELKTIDWANAGSAIRLLIVGDGYTPSPDHNFVSDVVAQEISTTGYTRKDVTNRTITEDDTNDRAVYDADDVSWASLGTTPAVNGRYAIVYLRVGVDDSTPADDILITCQDFSLTAFNGSPFNLAWNANGLFTLT